MPLSGPSADRSLPNEQVLSAEPLTRSEKNIHHRTGMTTVRCGVGLAISGRSLAWRHNIHNAARALCRVMGCQIIDVIFGQVAGHGCHFSTFARAGPIGM